MNVLYIAYYTAVRYLRNIMCVLFFLAAPLLMIYSTTSGGGMTYQKLAGEFSEKIGYITADKGELAKQFSKVKDLSSENSSLKYEDISSYEEGMKQLKKGSIDSFIYIDKAASDNFAQGRKTEIKVFTTRKISAAKTIVEGFVNNTNGIITVVRMGSTPEMSIPTRNMDVTTVSTKGKMASINDMAVLGNILLFLFYGAILGSYSIINDITKNTALRFKCAPVRYFENITGKSLGNILMMSISTTVIILFSKFVLKVNWDGNIPMIVAAILLYLIVVNNLGVIIAGFTRNIYICGLITFALNFFLVYGVMVYAYAPGKETTLGIGKLISPHYYAFDAIIGSIYSSSSANVQLSMIVLTAGAMMTTAISFIVGRRRIG